MGAVRKTETIEGKTLQSAFANLQVEAMREYGDDFYSGGWNNATGVREVSSSYYNDNKEDVSKHEDAIAVCIRKPKANTNAIKTTVDRVPNKGTRKWVTMYVGHCNSDSHYIDIREELQSEAIKKARTYVSKNPGVKIAIHIEKELCDQSSLVAHIKYKPSSSEADGMWEITGELPF